jgi:hypothetical protein
LATRALARVSSTFGVMFVAEPEAAALELARVCRKGGRIGLASWVPEGGVAGLFAVLRRYMPAPTTAAPSLSNGGGRNGFGNCSAMPPSCGSNPAQRLCGCRTAPRSGKPLLPASARQKRLPPILTRQNHLPVPVPSLAKTSAARSTRASTSSNMEQRQRLHLLRLPRRNGQQSPRGSRDQHTRLTSAPEIAWCTLTP